MTDDQPEGSDALAITVTYHLVHGVPWAELGSSQRDSLTSLVAKSPLTGTSPTRRGFVECVANPQGVFGQFYAEFPETATTYDGNKQPVLSEGVNSERLFFALSAEMGLCVLQSRRFTRSSGLRMGDVRDQFFGALGDLLASGGYNDTRSEAVTMKQPLDRDEVWRWVRERRVSELSVSGISESHLRPQYPVYNPDPNPEAFFEEYVYARGAPHLDRVDMKATKGGNLAKVPEARAYISAADIDRVVSELGDGRVEVMERWNGRREVAPPNATESVAELLARLIDLIPAGTVIKIKLPKRRAPQGRLDL